MQNRTFRAPKVPDVLLTFWVIKLLTMQRVEYQADGPLTQLARDVLGLGDVSGLAQRADEEKADYPSIRVRPDYIKPQDVSTTQDVALA